MSVTYKKIHVVRALLAFWIIGVKLVLDKFITIPIIFCYIIIFFVIGKCYDKKDARLIKG